MTVDFRKVLESLPSGGKAAVVELASRIQVLVTNNAMDGNDVAQATSLIRAMANKYNIQISGVAIVQDPKEQLIGICRYFATSRGSILAESYTQYPEELIEYYESGQEVGGFGIARLTGEDKQSIHSHLNSIRELIEKSPIDIRKKNKLFVKLAALSAEVDRLGTRTDAFFAFVGDIAFVSGQMAENAKPAIEQIKSVMKIVMRSRADNEGVSLPSSENIPQLPNITEI